MPPEKTSREVSAILRQGTLVEAALNAAVREAVLRHRQQGLPLAVWRDGQTIWIPPEEILPPESGGDNQTHGDGR
jgi:hypothetical protein